MGTANMLLIRTVSHFALVLRNLESTCTLLFLGKGSSFKMDNQIFSPIVTYIAIILETDKVRAQHCPTCLPTISVCEQFYKL